MAHTEHRIITRQQPPAPKGMIASQPIPLGTLIVVEEPLISIPSNLPAEAVNSICDRLPSDSQKKILLDSLQSLRPELNYNDTIRLQQKHLEESGLFATISRLNHSCHPNALFFWDQAQSQGIVHAIRNINAEEEITIAHHDIFVPSCLRIPALAKIYITCSCYKCLDAADKLYTKSDDRILSISHLFAATMSSDLPPLEAMDKLEEAFEYLEEEELWSMFQDGYELGFRLCVMWGDEDNAKKWAKAVKDTLIAKRGSDNEEVEYWEKKSNDPKVDERWRLCGKSMILRGPLDTSLRHTTPPKPPIPPPQPKTGPRSTTPEDTSDSRWTLDVQTIPGGTSGIDVRANYTNNKADEKNQSLP